jgi:hypothetical protein
MAMLVVLQDTSIVGRCLDASPRGSPACAALIPGVPGPALLGASGVSDRLSGSLRAAGGCSAVSQAIQRPPRRTWGTFSTKLVQERTRTVHRTMSTRITLFAFAGHSASVALARRQMPLLGGGK